MSLSEVSLKMRGVELLDIDERYLDLTELPKLINNYFMAGHALDSAGHKRDQLLKRNYGSNICKKKLKANINLQKLKEEFSYCESAIVILIMHDSGIEWNRSTHRNTIMLKFRGDVLNILYGKDKAASKNHGHYIIDLNEYRIIYHRPYGAPHGPQNYLNYNTNNNKLVPDCCI